MKLISKIKLIWISFVLSLFFVVVGCSAYSDMNGTVVDAETGEPVEGAVVLVEWTKTRGIGFTNAESYKVQEVVTDKDGKFVVSGVLTTVVNKPDVTVYKKGYVAWSSRMIFPNWQNRTDFKWASTYTFKMERFKGEYSYDKHVSFISSATNSSLSSDKKIIKSAYRWEELMASQELDDAWRKQKELAK